MRIYKMYIYCGDDCISINHSTSRDARKKLETFNEQQRREGNKEADRCVVYTLSMSRLADVRVVRREGLPDAYVYYPI